MRHPILILACLAAMTAVPAGAQTTERDSAAQRDPDGNLLIVGLGVGTMPAYEGSGQGRIVPVPGVIGRINGTKFMLLGNQASLDLIKDKPGTGWDFQIGPYAAIGFNRNMLGAIDDLRIRALGKVGIAAELGGYVGIARQGVITSDYDRLSFSVSARHDIAGAHDGTLIVPTVSYITPLSEKTLVTLYASATHADGHYARTYYSITPQQSVASTLPVFDAQPGWSNWMVGAGGLVSLSGNLEHGLQLGGGVAYGRMLNSFARSPVVSIAGSRNQFMAALGLAYSF